MFSNRVLARRYVNAVGKGARARSETESQRHIHPVECGGTGIKAKDIND